MSWLHVPLLLLLTLFLTPALLLATDFYVSPAGKDSNPGTVAAPLKTLGAARDKVRSLAGRKTVTVHVADGVYYLPQALILKSEDSGSDQHPIVYRAKNTGKAVLSGGTKLVLQWRPYRDGIFQASTPTGLTIDQLFVNGTGQRMARYPNYDADQTTAAYQGFAADAFSKERAADWSDPTGGYIHAMHRARWGGYHYRITGKKPDDEVTYEGGWQNNRQMGMHKDFRMVENIVEELDAPGEWFHDAKKNTLFYKPDLTTTAAKLESAIIEVVRLRHLIEFEGTEESPVKFVTLQGFVVRHAARTFMETKEPLLRSDWAIYRGGAVKLTGTEDVQILDTEFDQVGGNAIFVNQYNRRVLVKGCHIHDAGASGVCFVGDPNAVRDPLFQYREKNDLSQIDRTPGPKTNNYPADSAVEDCLIHGIGRVERQPAGVLIEMAQHITVRDCSIYDCARAGINIGDGAWGGHLIERCDVFDTVQETHDHGSFNSWGRDRYWRSDQRSSQAAVDNDPKLPFLDAVETTVIRNSRWRCDHGWDIDLDDGSSNYDIYNNLMLSGGLKLREGFRRRAWNNITVNNGLHPHVWYNDSDDEVFGNIFMAASRGARMPSETAKGKRVDRNLYFTTDSNMKDVYAQFGWEANSIVADPMFVDPTSGDFRVRDSSPAFKIGFKNFPMDQFGVKRPALRAIAQTPTIPELKIRDKMATARSDSPKPRKNSATYWLGAKLRSLKGQEFSAFGVRQEDGGVVLMDIRKSCDAAKAGLQEGDLIQGMNGSKVKVVADLMNRYLVAGDEPLTLNIVRDQQPVEVQVATSSFLIFETSDSADGFSSLTLPKNQSHVVASNQSTKNDSLRVLSDGQLKKGYGPVFANGQHAGMYRMNLGQSMPVSAISTWSTNQNSNRGFQKLTLYGSSATKDPGWNVADRAQFIPLGTIDTKSQKPKTFSATSLRARADQSLGTYRWIYWKVSPVTKRGENTAFQELHVE